MDKRKRSLKESLGEEFGITVAKAKATYYFRKALAQRLKEAVLDGSGYCNGDDDCCLGEVYNQVILGCEPFLTREVARVFITDKCTLVIPLNTMATAVDMTCNQDTSDAYAIAGETTTCRTIQLNKEPGIRALWTKSYVEDASWAVFERQARGAGRAIEEYILDLIIEEYIFAVGVGGVSVGQVACYTSTATGPAITWAEFVAAVGYHEGLDGHPNILFVAPDLYAALLALQQFTDASWMGSEETMRSGVILTTFGMKVIRSSRLPDGIGFLIDNDIAGALAIRREITIEPYERPEINQYGFVASARIGFEMMHGCGLVMLSAC